MKKFYYLELLRRAGWQDSVQEETFIELHVPEEKRRNADESLCKFGVRRGALRIAIGAGASYGSAKCWPPPRFAEVANRLQAEAEAEADVDPLWNIPLRPASRRPSPPVCAGPRSICTGKTTQSPTCPRCYRNAISLSATIPARCTLPPLLACPSVAPCSARPIPKEPRRSPLAAISFSKNPIAAPVFSAAARPTTGA